MREVTRVQGGSEVRFRKRLADTRVDLSSGLPQGNSLVPDLDRTPVRDRQAREVVGGVPARRRAHPLDEACTATQPAPESDCRRRCVAELETTVGGAPQPDGPGGPRAADDVGT